MLNKSYLGAAPRYTVHNHVWKRSRKIMDIPSPFSRGSTRILSSSLNSSFTTPSTILQTLSSTSNLAQPLISPLFVVVSLLIMCNSLVGAPSFAFHCIQCTSPARGSGSASENSSHRCTDFTRISYALVHKFQFSSLSPPLQDFCTGHRVYTRGVPVLSFLMVNFGESTEHIEGLKDAN
ncbi:hypothetical protein E1B28_009410 [Marasmius oreades]|uniref:Uncharacterized protein n=1 Tax=Marasmius oreades TaxID=181124 RepID=A0A9P7UTE2_9AGAR|nr:uncharacterized protein E1B28_009410 [Marasmius oreades]KAG7093125.1 hypothetical protein E1B28_009410 [Marasmius oreades]